MSNTKNNSMKKSMLMLVSTAIALTLTITSCEKEEVGGKISSTAINYSDDNWKKEINSYVLAVQSNPSTKPSNLNSTQGIKLDWGRMAADFTTGIEWGFMGLELTGCPHVALGTALAGSLLGSLAYGRVVPTNTEHPYSDNPKTLYGKMHNYVCLEVVPNDEYYINDTTMSDSFIEYVEFRVYQNLGVTIDIDDKFGDYNQWALQCRNDFRDGQYSRSISDEDAKFFVDKFLGGINPDFNHEEFLDYVKEFESIIQGSDLPEFKKDLFLSHLSIASHSAYIW